MPLRFNTAARVAMMRHGRGLAALVLELARCWLALARRRWRLPRADAVIVATWGTSTFTWPASVSSHATGAGSSHQLQRHRAGSWRARPPEARRAVAIDRAALTVADIVIVDTEEHRRLLPARMVARSVVVAVGADRSWFRAGDGSRTAPQTAIECDEPLRVVFFGLYTPLQGTVTIGAALALLDGSRIAVTMIGDGQDRPAAAAAAQGSSAVKWLDWAPAGELPAIVAAHDVCLGIFGRTPKALRVVPNKVFQGAAAGCVVVTSDTVPQRRMLGNAGLFVAPGDPTALATAPRALAEDRATVTALADRASQLARERFCAIAVIAPLEERLRVILGHGLSS